MTPARRAAVLGGALVAVATFVLQSSCGDGAASTSNPGATQSAAAGGGPVTSTASGKTSSDLTTVPAGGGSGSKCKPEPLPAGVPAGWIEYGNWSCSCRFYVPGSRDALPKPLVWQTCPDASLGYSCKYLASADTSGVYSIGVYPSFKLLKNGAAVFAINHPDEDVPGLLRNTHLVADLDGATRFAMMQITQATVEPRCALRTTTGSVGDTRHIIEVDGDGVAPGNWNTSAARGALGGDIDVLMPDVLARYNAPSVYEWSCNAAMVVSSRTPDFEMRAYPWSMNTSEVVTSAALDPDKLANHDPVLVGDSIFYQANNDPYEGIDIWTPKEGTRPFIRWVGDATREAGSFGTDGIDMAWRYGERSDISLRDYSKVTLMTAKFTTDPNGVKAKPVRALSEGDHVAGKPVAVGCGFAASTNDAGGEMWGVILLARLADGRNWSFKGTKTVRYDRVLGVTCKEVVIASIVQQQTTLVRVAIDSLGQGEPAQ